MLYSYIGWFKWCVNDPKWISNYNTFLWLRNTISITHSSLNVRGLYNRKLFWIVVFWKNINKLCKRSFLLLVNKYVPKYIRNLKNAATNIFTRLIKYESPFFWCSWRIVKYKENTYRVMNFSLYIFVMILTWW